MIEAVVSGEAGRFVLLGRQPTLHSFDVDPREIGSGSVARVLAGCEDLDHVKVGTIKEAEVLARLAWSKDRALRFALFLLDLDEEPAYRDEYADCLQGLIREPPVHAFLMKRLLSSPISEQLLLTIANGLTEFPAVETIYRDLAGLQNVVRRVREGFDEAMARIPESWDAQFISEAILSREAIGEVVQLIASGISIDFFVLKLIGDLRSVDGARAAIDSWTAPMRSQKRIVLPRSHFKDEEDFEHEDRPSAGAYARVMRQQAGILERLRNRDLEGARRFVHELVRDQAFHSTPEQLGKSLSRLAHQAKLMGIAELQVEWAQLAVQHSPNDPRTFSHLADAYIATFQLSLAGDVCDRLEQMGDVFHAIVGRGRILREKGKFPEAREAFVSAAVQFPYDESVHHALASAAECLREMGQLEEALLEYQGLTEAYPLQAPIWAGLGSVLVDLGRTAEAIKNFGIAAKHGDGVIAQSGRAAAYRYAGEFDTALKIYSDLIRRYPSDYTLLSGRAEVYRDKSQFAAALKDYQQAVKVAPFHPAPLLGVVKVLRDLRKYDDALAMADAGLIRFSYYAPLAASRGSILMRQHRYREALQAYDATSSDFPLDYRVAKSRADALRQLGMTSEALNAYEEVILHHPHFLSAQVAKASLLIEMERYEEAEKLLPAGRPASKFAWRMHLLRALLLESTGKRKQSEAILAQGSRAPFAGVRRNFKAALARQNLLRNRPSPSRLIVEPADNEISNVVWLHSLAASGRTESAKKAYQDILKTTTEPKLIDLSTEIASRFRLIEKASQRSRDWIFAEERSAILQAA